jgi:predicted glycoside hydrolase/deacetylase ChbG (UPF0249 family)
VVTRLAKRLGIGYVRCARELRIPDVKLSPGYQQLCRYAQRLRNMLAAEKIRSSDYFFGLALTGRMNAAAWLEALPTFPEGVGEVMVHPGHPEGLTEDDTRLLSSRTVELEALQDRSVAYAVQAQHMELIHYGTLTAGR